MPRRDKYSPDYSKLYSGVHIAPEVMRVLTGSDRKMRYCEYDLKTERVRKNAKTKATMVYPAREDSLDRLSEENNRHYALEVDSPEELVAAQDEIIRLNGEELSAVAKEHHYSWLKCQILRFLTQFCIVRRNP